MYRKEPEICMENAEQIIQYYEQDLQVITNSVVNIHPSQRVYDHDDLMQEARLAAFSAIRTYCPGAASFRTYMGKVVKNALLNFVLLKRNNSYRHETAMDDVRFEDFVCGGLGERVSFDTDKVEDEVFCEGLLEIINTYGDHKNKTVRVAVSALNEMYRTNCPCTQFADRNGYTGAYIRKCIGIFSGMLKKSPKFKKYMAA